VRFEETQQRGEKRRISGPGAKLVRPDSGQVEEPLRPPPAAERCGERGKGESNRIVWTRVRKHLDTAARARGSELAKILIVEDNALNIKLFCDLLAAHGHEPEAVSDSRNALDTAKSFSPDLVITDIQLPHVSGLELIRMIRSDEQIAEVPIMAVTAYSAQGDEERIRAAGAQAYVSKPISVVRFVQTVDELLNGNPEKVDELVAMTNESPEGLGGEESQDG
jgi:two-component system cell cycle response regulator DivK